MMRKCKLLVPVMLVVGMTGCADMNAGKRQAPTPGRPLGSK